MLGATQPRAVDVRFCFATHRDLREAVSAGTFCADLYNRVALPEVALTPLRDRPEEIAWHVARTCAAEQRTASAVLVEACMLRPWFGNVRELRAAVRDACFRGQGEVTDEHLASDAGLPLEQSADPQLSRERIESALASAGGSITTAARALGLRRTQLYRVMKRLKISRP